MPFRITRPWLLLDWIYKMTETASAELAQKRKLNAFTKKVCLQSKLYLIEEKLTIYVF